jgi:hypothetical protein
MRLAPSQVIALQKAMQAGTGITTALLVAIFLTPQDYIQPSYRHLTDPLMEILFAKA